MNSSYKKDITGLILAGGASRRMQDYASDKGLLEFNNQPLVTFALQRLSLQVQSLAISANRNIAEYQALGVPVWPDLKEPDWETFPGPLAGIYTGLSHLTTEWLVTAPCDSPLLPLDLVEQLYSKAQKSKAKIVIACTENDDGVKDHPVFALVHHSLKQSLYEELCKGSRKILSWMEQHTLERVIFRDSQALMVNINTVADLTNLSNLTEIK